MCNVSVYLDYTLNCLSVPQVEVCWASLQLNLLLMVSGLSPRSPVTQVISSITSSVPSFLSLSPSVTLKASLIQRHVRSNFYPEMKPHLDHNLIFIFYFSLCQIWWLTWTSLLLMKVSWWPAPVMRRWVLWPFTFFLPLSPFHSFPLFIALVFLCFFLLI